MVLIRLRALKAWNPPVRIVEATTKRPRAHITPDARSRLECAQGVSSCCKGIDDPWTAQALARV